MQGSVGTVEFQSRTQCMTAEVFFVFLPLQNMNTAHCNRKFEIVKFEEDELMSFEMML
jgi:hypothetical protein